MLAENYLTDFRVAYLSPSRQPSTDIAIVMIDETSISGQPYRSPIDRELISGLLSEIEARNPRAIGLNIIFERQTELQKDRALFNRLRSVSVPLVVSSASVLTGFSDRQDAFSSHYLSGLDTSLSIIYQDSIDQVVRSSMLKMSNRDDTYLGFAAALAKKLGIPLPAQNEIVIDYRAGLMPGEPAFPIYPAHRVSGLAKTAIESQIVLIGTNLDGARRFRTPVSLARDENSMGLTGIEIEAHVLSQLIEQRSFSTTTGFENGLITLLMALVGVAVALSPLRLVFKILLALVLASFAWLGGIYGFYLYGVMLPMVSPTFSFVFALSFGTLWQWRRENQQKEKLHTAFGQYLAPELVEQIAENPEGLSFSGESREISFVFTDLEGFTRLVESIDPRIMVKLLNTYLDEACEIVMSHGGTIDKIVGDALHVMFNAPLAQKDHAQRAVECAIELDRWAQGFQFRQIDQGIDLGVTRIGVNTGKCIVGNFGGGKRFDYTAHGDAINTTARLEAVNQRLGTTLCIAHSTVEQCKGIPFRPLANLVLAGKKRGVRTYVPRQLDTDSEELVKRYEYAYSLLERDAPEVAATFAELKEQFPDDTLVRLHSNRLESGESGEIITMRRK
jgi:class 3 adenylate cyclase/CHASE2 domain-containing sensor protein